MTILHTYPQIRPWPGGSGLARTHLARRLLSLLRRLAWL